MAKRTAKKIKTILKSKSKTVLLSGGNPQIPMGDGNGPVQAYIAAMPGWKHKMGKAIDAIVTRAVPKVKKAVKWNSPLYGVEGKGWFISVHCFNEFVRVTFFSGAGLDPLPPGESSQKKVRYFDIYEEVKLDKTRFSSWIRQASKLQGWGK